MHAHGAVWKERPTHDRKERNFGGDTTISLFGQPQKTDGCIAKGDNLTDQASKCTATTPNPGPKALVLILSV